MHKEVVVHIHNGRLHSHKEEHIWVSSNVVDEPRTYYIEWSKSERDREISYFNAYIQKLEKWYWRIHLQGSNGETDWFQIGKGVRQGCVLSPCLFNLYAEYIMRNLGWKKHKLESRLLGDISITSDMQVTPPLWQKVKKNWRPSWWMWKRRVKKLA